MLFATELIENENASQVIMLATAFVMTLTLMLVGIVTRLDEAQILIMGMLNNNHDVFEHSSDSKSISATYQTHAKKTKCQRNNLAVFILTAINNTIRVVARVRSLS